MSERDRLHLGVMQADAKAAESMYIPVPEGGKVVRITAIPGTTLVGDAVITTEIGGTLVTGGGMTLSATAAGVLTSVVPTGANVIPKGGSLEIINAGAATTGAALSFQIEVERNQ